MKTRPEPLHIGENIFEELENAEEFQKKVRQYYNYIFTKSGLQPVISETRLKDAWEAFCHDKKHIKDSMSPRSRNKPNHFKLSGILAYWLRRSAPVYDVKAMPPSAVYPENAVFEELLKQYPSECSAYDFGLAICNRFETGKEKAPSGPPDVGADKLDYYWDICYLLKRKNLSPHSLGMIYRSLFVPLRPIPDSDNPAGNL